MVSNFDHVTIAVREIEPAIRFFALLGFVHERTVVIAGEPFAGYLGVPGLEAQHVTLVLAGAAPRCEVQLLHYLHPDPVIDYERVRLDRVGFNHVCFAVADLDAEVARLRADGVTIQTDVLDFRERKLAFLTGPEGVTIELSQVK